MAYPDLLITGTTGFIGFKALLGALEEGYSVRAAVRSREKGLFLLGRDERALGIGHLWAGTKHFLLDLIADKSAP